MELWNRRDMRVPPNNSVKMKKGDIDIIHLKSIFKNALKIMEEKHLLHKEAAILSRYIYRDQKSMRGQKVLMYMKKVNRGLKRYISVDLQHVYNNFNMMLLCDDDDGNDEYMYVPTKQMLQYVLVRTQAFCKIMKYLSIACQDSALHFRAIICRGHQINGCLLGLSMISRIWYCTRYFTICACQWYNQLLPYLEKLKIKGPCWLPVKYEFPGNLRSWLGSDPIAGEIKFDVDVQKISQDISQIENFKDTGTLVKREDFLASIKEKAYISQRRNAKLGFVTKNDKLFTTASDANLMSHEENSLLTTRDKSFDATPLQKVSIDLHESSFCDQFVAQNVNHKSVSSAKNIFNSINMEGDVGELISRDKFLAQKARNERVSAVDEFSKTPYEIQSENNQLFLKSTKDLPGSFKDPADISRPSVRDDYSRLLETARKNTDESHKFTSSTEGKRKPELKTVLNSPLKFDKSIYSNVSKIPIHTIKSHKITAKDKRKTVSTNKCLPSKVLTNAFHSSDKSQESEFFKRNCSASKKMDAGIQKISINTSADNSQIQKKIVPSIESQDILKSNQHIANMVEYDLNMENVSVQQQQYAVSARPLGKKNKKSLGNWEIINGIRTIKDVKAFLLSEKKARAKGKICVTSKLSNSEWNILLEAINTFLKKESDSKVKANKKIKTVMEEVRNTLISFVI